VRLEMLGVRLCSRPKTAPKSRLRRFITKHAPGPLKATRSRRHRNGSGIVLRALTGPPSEPEKALSQPHLWVH
jgi:hypothetical protein